MEVDWEVLVNCEFIVHVLLIYWSKDGSNTRSMVVGSGVGVGVVWVGLNVDWEFEM